MRRTLLLLASLAFASLTSVADGAPLKVMSASNVFRVGAAENIFVECQDCTGGDIRVDINVMNHPTKIKLLIPAGDFNKNPSVKQYVYLQAQFPDCLLEKVVMVSFQSGYIFIQTDKTLYTPNSRVLFRVFALTPQMEPLERDEEIQTDTSIIIEFVTPEGIILLLRRVFLRSGLYSGSFNLDETVSTGLWKVVAKFHSNPQQKYSAEFEVKEYVLSSFEVKLTPLTQFFYVNSRDFTVRIKATYLFGQEVDGTAYVVFGVRKGQRKQSFPDSLQKVPIRSGEGEVTLRREDITKVENDINSLVGGAIFVSVSVLTESGSEMVEAELRGIQIVTSPYMINFKRTQKYFKPGMSFDVRVEVLNPDETPAANIPVVINPGAVRGLTAANGMAWLTINTRGNGAELRITLVSRYYAKPKEHKSDCQDFTLSVELIPEETNTNDTYRLRIEVMYKNRDRDASMSILDIGLPFGFAVETRDLDLLSTGRGRTIAKYEMYKALSERGSVIIYLDKVSHTQPEEIAFRIKQEMRVGVLQPTAVSVYEYYEQTRCVKYYNAQMGAGKLQHFSYTCLRENCSMQKENITNDQRQAKICESTETHKVDFAYKVHVAEFLEEVSTDSHKVQVLDTIKEGNLDANPVNKHRIFLSYQHCREALGLEKDKTYLIMGSDKAIYRDDKMTFKYMIDERTWVEYWPTAEECQTDKYWDRCLSLELMVNQYSVFGCIAE